MDAIISAKAGLAIFVRGNETSVFNINDLETESIYPVSSIRYLLSGANDVRKIKNITREESFSLLQKECSKSRAITMTLILLDEMEENETIDLTIECLQDLLVDTDVLDHVENTLYSNIMPENANLLRANEYAKSIDKLSLILNDVEKNSQLILKFRKRWDSLSEDIFADPMDKILCEECLVSTGVFKELVKAGSDPKKFSLAHLRCLNVLQKYKNSRTVVSQWLTGLIPEKAQIPVSFNPQFHDFSFGTANNDKGYFKPKLKPHDAYQNALKQKTAINLLLKTGDWAKTRRYVEDLISSQRKSSEPEHISKSLCDLSQHAKLVKNYSLQLELAKRATEISSDDGWAYCQVAEAYICLAQFDNAIENFKLAETYGQHEYSNNGFARILKEQGRFDEAIAVYQKLMVDYPYSSYVSNCYAETLRDAWRIDDALAVYDYAIENLPYGSTTYCGKASILKSIGKLDEAITLFEYARNIGDDSHYIGTGIADVYRIQGEYDKSLVEYDKVIKKFPDEIVPRCAKAHVLRAKGDLPSALIEFQNISKEFPYDFQSKEGIAETLKEMKEYVKSMEIFDEIIKKFPMASWARNGRANLFKCMGEYSASLKAYDENVKDFPYDLVAWGGRADLLKQLGDLDESIKAFTRISELNPYDKSSVYSIAAIYVVKGQYDQALKLLPTEVPKYRDDWFAYHVKGMIYMKSGRVEEA